MATDKDVHEIVAVGLIITAAITGVIALCMFCFAAYDKSMTEVIVSVILALFAGASAYGAAYYGQRLNPDYIHNGSKEHVLTIRQKRLLRRKRGEVVLEQALIEVEQERDNITHRALEAANDPDKPPHPTQWTPPPGNQIEGPRY